MRHFPFFVIVLLFIGCGEEIVCPVGYEKGPYLQIKSEHQGLVKVHFENINAFGDSVTVISGEVVELPLDPFSEEMEFSFTDMEGSRDRVGVKYSIAVDECNGRQLMNLENVKIEYAGSVFRFYASIGGRVQKDAYGNHVEITKNTTWEISPVYGVILR